MSGPHAAMSSEAIAPEAPARLVAGCMTGTSLDGIDAALVEIHGRGLTMQARLVRCVSRPLGDLAVPLRQLAEQHPMTAGQIAALSRDFALAHADALRELAAGESLDLACIHGQTVYHNPPASWQLLNPAPIARALNAPIVYDLRAADLAAGGQGAPITPLADWILFRRAGETPGFTAVVNLGGFCNITVLPPSHRAEQVRAPGWTSYTPTTTPVGARPVGTLPTEADAAAEIAEIQGFDVCACNQLLDAVARALLGVPYDAGGERALRGTVHAKALEDLSGLLHAQSRGRRSLGTGDEAGEWIARWRSAAAPEDLAATACEAIAQQIAERTRHAGAVMLAGGGARNAALTRAIASGCSCVVEPVDARGVPVDHREAACFAVLGALCQDRVPITLPQVTGVPAPAPLAGAWVYP